MKTVTVLILGLLLACLVGCETTSSTRPVPFAQAVAFTGDYVKLADVDQKPMAVKMSGPQFPTTWSRLNISGAAWVSFIVDETGATTQVQCARATDKEFGEAAIAAVKQWRFKPARKDGKVVACAIDQLMEFNLQGPR